MATTIRPKISAKNPYSIDKHRYYELKHFVMQLPSWKAKLAELDGYGARKENLGIQKTELGDPTEKLVEEREYFYLRIEMVARVAKETDSLIGERIVEGIIDGVSYDILNARRRVPCGKEMYYELYRKFFWLLDKARK